MQTLDDLKHLAPSATTYLDRAGQAIMAATLAFDYARSAEKMVDPNCAGDTNPAWQTGPFLTIFHGAQQIGRNAPSVMQVSVESNMASYLVNGPNTDENAVDLPAGIPDHNQADHIIAKLAIIEQFELFQDYMKSINGPYNATSATGWQDSISQDTLNTIVQLAERRQELLNDMKCEASDMREAVDFFHAAVQTAAEVSSVF